MTKHVQDPRQELYQASVCGDNPNLTGGCYGRQFADCPRCISIYDKEFES